MIESEMQEEKLKENYTVLATLPVSQIWCGFILLGINNEQDEQAYTLEHIHRFPLTHLAPSSQSHMAIPKCMQTFPSCATLPRFEPGMLSFR